MEGGVRGTLGANRATIYVDPNEMKTQVLLAGDNIRLTTPVIGGVSRLRIDAIIPSSGSSGTGSGS